MMYWLMDSGHQRRDASKSRKSTPNSTTLANACSTMRHGRMSRGWELNKKRWSLERTGRSYVRSTQQ